MRARGEHLRDGAGNDAHPGLHFARLHDRVNAVLRDRQRGISHGTLHAGKESKQGSRRPAVLIVQSCQGRLNKYST